ncbi:hypothetical protein K376_01166 [Streptomyces sp. PsTaAH-130]|nr:hypothetical protein K376_01166 [Streptomyces sp. PsTaAH-130]
MGLAVSEATAVDFDGDQVPFGLSEGGLPFTAKAVGSASGTNPVTAAIPLPVRNP